MTGRDHWLAAELRRQERNDREGMRAITSMFLLCVVSLTTFWPAAIVFWLTVWP